jgi:hypothetical protein
LAESLLTKIPTNIGQSLKQSAEIGSCSVIYFQPIARVHP